MMSNGLCFQWSELGNGNLRQLLKPGFANFRDIFILGVIKRDMEEPFVDLLTLPSMHCLKDLRTTAAFSPCTGRRNG